jgi:hypothetical protein
MYGGEARSVRSVLVTDGVFLELVCPNSERKCFITA